jgi:sulfatase maturation enzyme AslB (radical SAM superfamily)
MRRFVDRLSYGFETFVLRRERPYLFGLVINDQCNLDCYYCESKNSGLYDFNAEGALESLREAYQRGHRSLYFTGGEPMLWADGGLTLADLVVFARELGFFEVFIFTNGTLALEIEDCNYIVTVDGTAEAHNEIRGDSYDLVMENVRSAVTRTVFASITLTRSNSHCLEEFVRDIASLGLFRGISFNLLTHWPEVVEKEGIVGEERVLLLDRIWQLKKEGYPIVLSRAAYLALRRNDWKRPIKQIELGTRDRVFTCCRDVDNPEVCADCGYANCVEVSQILALKPSAMLQVLRMVE